MASFDRREVATFLAVNRQGSIRAASEQLGVAPSVVSRQVAEIEARLGMKLFERSVRGVALTEAGVLVLEHLRRVTEEYGVLHEQLSGLRGIQQRHVRIHCGEGFLADFVQNGLGRALADSAQVYYDLKIGSTEAVVAALANGESDIGIAYNPPATGVVRSVVQARQPLCVIAPPEHPVLALDHLSLEDCLDYPLAMLGQGHGTTDLLMRVAADSGFALGPRLTTTSIDALRRFVASGLGLSFLPRSSVSTELTHGLVAARELEDLTLSAAAAHLMVRARRRLPRSVDRLVRHLAEGMASFS
ncbi:LysR family transcriptional regulator [Acidimangrovimonas sediminis]|uniref:LysR family transcriptional regulator n=1 Tax=Acidimangrovimonas sediminis TaxID=2056283 RepID=UPI000C7FD2AA|nr:LysR family transcriptional regulator [Acidimangrovimonas sediminis]